MASLALNLLGPTLAVEVDPRLTSAPVAINFGPGSWLALTADEALALSLQLADAAALVRPPVGTIQHGNTDLTSEHQSLGRAA